MNNHKYYFFDGINNVNDLDLNNILLDEKSCEIFSIYDVAYKTRYGSKLLRIMFDKFRWITTKYNSTKYLALFHSGEKYDRIFDRIRYLIMLKNNISNVYSHKYTISKLIQIMTYV